MADGFHYHKDYLPYRRRVFSSKIRMTLILPIVSLILGIFILLKNGFNEGNLEITLGFFCFSLLFFIAVIFIGLLPRGIRFYTTDIVLSDGVITIKSFKYDKPQHDIRIALDELALVHRLYNHRQTFSYHKLIFSRKDPANLGRGARMHTLYGDRFWSENEIKDILSKFKSLQGGNA